MSTTMHTIYSDTILGVGLSNGSPYGFGHLGTQRDPATTEELNAQLQESIDLVRDLAVWDPPAVDAPYRLNGWPVSIISGEADRKIPPVLQEYQKLYYENFNSHIEFLSVEN